MLFQREEKPEAESEKRTDDPNWNKRENNRADKSPAAVLDLFADKLRSRRGESKSQKN